MNTTITMDKAGRVVLPKAVRDELNLSAGDSLELSSDGGGLTLRPARAANRMIRKGGFWIMARSSDPTPLQDPVEMIREMREARMNKILGVEE